MLNELTRQKIGSRIRECRITNSLTQAQFAESIDISINFLSEIENGKKGLSYETLYNICKNHSISADYILFGNTSSKDRYSTITKFAGNLTESELETLIKYLNALLELKKL
ncbi:MAG: helix-turn-helix domain-containing protein [Clostridium sp.]|nr:helix-turn-helix domain-containing protein [Clostridium sp.]